MKAKRKRIKEYSKTETAEDARYHLGGEESDEFPYISTRMLDGETAVLQKMGASFGQDFSDVKIHQNDSSAEKLHARAYTQGNDIYFAPGEYNPAIKEGLELIGHEFTHVVQQRNGRTGYWQINGSGLINADADLEHEATTVGSKVSEGKSVNVSGNSSLSIQRETNDEEISEWRKSGNLIGEVPVRNEYTVPDINVMEYDVEYDILYKKVIGLQKEQDERAAKMTSGNQISDFNFWFAKVYSLVTKYILEYVERGAFYYPTFVLRSVIYFEKLYNANLEAYEKGEHVEEHWQKAFAASAKNKEHYSTMSKMQQQALEPRQIPAPSPFDDGSSTIAGVYAATEPEKALDVVDSLVQSMLAHIRFDLPRADAWVYAAYYKNQTPSLDTFLIDFMTMGGVFDLAGFEMQTVISEKGSKLADLAPKSIQEMAMRHHFDANMTKERADTWQRADELSKLPQDQMPKNPIDKDFNVEMENGKSYTSWLNNIETKPTMEKTSPYTVKDSQSVLDMEPLAIAKLSLIQRIQLLAQMLDGPTGEKAEKAILKILNATLEFKPTELTTLIDGVDPWELLLDLDDEKFAMMKQFLAEHYYGEAPLVSIIRLLNSSVIAWVMIDEIWEGEVILAALSTRADREAIVIKILGYFSNRIEEAHKNDAPLLQALSLLSKEVMANNQQVERLYALFNIPLNDKNSQTNTKPNVNRSSSTEENNSKNVNVQTVKGNQQPYMEQYGNVYSFDFVEEKLLKKIDKDNSIVEVKIAVHVGDTVLYIDAPLKLNATRKPDGWHVQFSVSYVGTDRTHTLSASDIILNKKFTDSFPK